MKNIRNFCIIAHIDHWKSTLADRFLEVTNQIEKREMKNDQMLDTMDIEQERWITIKLQPVRLNWKWYQLNLIDTPWHVDFQYEVSRSLAACEWAILVVDATQGIEAQTLSNVYLAIENNIEIIPIVNKIDLPAANVDKVANEIVNLIWCKKEEIIPVSAKMGTNVNLVLDKIIEKVPSPQDAWLRVDENITSDEEMKALIFDSIYDKYKWILAFVRIASWEIKRWTKCFLLWTKIEIEVLEVWIFCPKYKAIDCLYAWEVWYIVTWLKSTRDARVWDTVYSWKKWYDATPLSWYKKMQPMVFAWIFCTDANEYSALRIAIEKLALNDASLTFEPTNSMALWSWFRCGFLWLLHMDIIQERLEREYWLDLITTAPSVKYEITYRNWNIEEIQSAEQMPDRSFLTSVKEPIVKLEIITPGKYTWAVMELCQQRRWIYKNLVSIDENRNMIVYEMPLATIITDFFDNLKSITSWYSSMNYELIWYKEDNLIKMDILVNWDLVNALSTILHKSEWEYVWRIIIKKLKDIIPKTQFPIALQAAIWWKVIARETIPALRKDVTAKLYWWDVTRKNKVLEKQREWKKRMKQFWSVEIPQSAFMAVLKRWE